VQSLSSPVSQVVPATRRAPDASRDSGIRLREPAARAVDLEEHFRRAKAWCVAQRVDVRWADDRLTLRHGDHAFSVAASMQCNLESWMRVFVAAVQHLASQVDRHAR
jgi:hypothetical protein